MKHTLLAIALPAALFLIPIALIVVNIHCYASRDRGGVCAWF